MSELSTPPHLTGHVSRWKWLLMLGVALMVLGIAGFGVVSFLELTSLLVFGIMLLTSSVLQLLIAFAVENKRESLLHLTAAGLEMVLAFFLMMNPPERIIGLITLIAFFLIAIGVARLIRAVMRTIQRRGWILAGGVVALLLGLSVWIGSGTANSVCRTLPGHRLPLPRNQLDGSRPDRAEGGYETPVSGVLETQPDRLSRNAGSNRQSVGPKQSNTRATGALLHRVQKGIRRLAHNGQSSRRRSRQAGR